MTPQLLEDLLALTGPVILPEYQLAIDEKNMLRALQDEVEVHYDKDLNQPKAVIGALLPVVMKRIPTALRNDPMGFAQAFTRAIDRRDLMIWSAREEEQSLIETMGWGGSVLQGEGDYLAVVHTNIGGGKTDRVMEETWERNLTFEGTSPITAQLVITRTHRGNPTDPYEKVQNVDYVRIFTPLGSELIGAQGFREPSTSLFKYERNLSPHPELVSLRASEKVHPAYNIRTTEEHGHTVFGGWIMTKVGVQSVVTLRYRIPYERAMIDHGVGLRAAIGGNVSTDRYRLTLQRQPGARVAKFIDTHISPASWGMADFNLIDEAGITSSLDKNMITFGVDHDMVYEVEWFHE